EIGSTIAQTPSLRDRGLVGYWTFDEGSGTTAYDRSGKGNNITLYNGPTWVSGKKYTAINFNRNYGIANLNSSTYPAFTVSGWGYLTDSSGGDASNWATFVRIGSFQIAASTAKIAVYSTPPSYVKSGNTFSLNSWHYLTWVATNNQIVMYIDGQQDTIGTLPSFPVNNVFYVGCWSLPNAQCWIGSIDELRIYNRALSAAEIASIYTATQ
ncbi:MAG: LamG domain-containing protein, partial [Candidatus Paceibacterota bacterium]